MGVPALQHPATDEDRDSPGDRSTGPQHQGARLAGWTAFSATACACCWDDLAAQYGEALAVMDPHRSPVVQYSFAQLADAIAQFASGLQSLGLSKGDKVSLFSENSSRWLIADQAIMNSSACVRRVTRGVWSAVTGAAAAVLCCRSRVVLRVVLAGPQVRGTSSSLEELQYIMQHSESGGLVVQDAATLDKLLPALGSSKQACPMRFVVVLWGSPSAAAAAALGSHLLTFDAVMARGAGQAFSPPEACAADLATLVYTSGTTGHPKGVMLTHANLLKPVRSTLPLCRWEALPARLPDSHS
ncbi:hypothetical protein CHLNCDRAFT_138341 [Chlorella variabilis]|uniref:AMP-dependent synthetase/ligase domain-containing protein n=1 Tax=Chlorella variabilis TaxID=554065 RepID=E1ZMU2_CHLVA|nr:hypothetical protein CHLNCDRAFT_138341 [Chlorella variabilis]EFN52860.1 hypothetical protein CHLNCDRAFT_138341 [Chlorella variabilis]|eukprot:XP_005844962.1 hypothetical protein CHLNCDRAFT_138341 [Chlorella variabilis]